MRKLNARRGPPRCGEERSWVVAGGGREGREGGNRVREEHRAGPSSASELVG